MPLAEGNQWEYVVRLDADESAESLRVSGPTAVGQHRGWLLEGVMGESRMAWAGDELLASELAGTAYSPPIPLLAPGDREWSGVVSTASGRTAGTAKLARSRENLDLGGRRYETVKTVLTLQCGGETVQLTTWFFQGMGILRQEQRRGAALTRDRYIEFVEGP